MQSTSLPKKLRRKENVLAVQFLSKLFNEADGDGGLNNDCGLRVHTARPFRHSTYA